MRTFIKNSLLRYSAYKVLNRLKEESVSSIFIPKSRILVLAPHPDDEVIGLGGLLLEAINNQCEIHIIFLTDGESSGAISDKERVKLERKKLTNEVFKKIGLNEENTTHFGLADGNLPHKNEKGFNHTVEKIIQFVDQWKPDCVFATHENDFWPYDHVACAQLAKAAIEQSKANPALYFYWVWAWYHLKPWNLKLLDFSSLKKIAIHKHLEKKQQLVNLYVYPKSPSGIPWSGSLPTGMLRPFKKPFEVVEKYE